MDVDANTLDVVNNEAERRFEIHHEGLVSVLDYRLHGASILYSHTGVPRELEHNGIGSRLAGHALNYAREQGLSVLPMCPFVAQHIRDHPEYVDLVPEDQRASYGLRGV